ncbi:MAG: hypothetical protein JST17_14615 [Bacteroidetes bacterium]|nr:hypothetical protein [Bacteroidota bacterium]MBS1930724.1 hypothetical protein [Bacteroidota bacterium]
MILRKNAILFFSLFRLLLLFSCSAAIPTNHNEKGVEAAMNHLNRLTLKTDADSIALLYTPDGNLGDVAIGRDSIRNFLARFKNIKVLSQKSTTDSINISGDTAIQKGKYYQSDLISGKDTVYVKGTFIAKWQWTNDKYWLIKEMHTAPMR